jgi:hypothetical protein
MNFKLKPWYQYRVEEAGYGYFNISKAFSSYEYRDLSKRLKTVMLMAAWDKGFVWQVDTTGWRCIHGAVG